MKKLLVVLLSLGLIAAVATTASAAVSMSVSGAYYVAGTYDNNPTLSEGQRYSEAAFHQRLRMMPVFQIAEGLTFTTRFDALEKHWGSTNWKSGTTTTASGVFEDTNSSRKQNTANLDIKIQENFEMEYSYITFKTAIGQFQVGYQDCDGWGTSFSSASNARAAFLYSVPFGPVTAGFKYEKWYEADGSVANLNRTDADADIYGFFGIYKYKGGDAGLLYRYITDSSRSRDGMLPAPFKVKVHQISPYFKAMAGPVYLEGEVNYFTGKAMEWQDATPAGYTGDVDAKTLTAYLMGKMNFGPAYASLAVGYASGNDEDKQEQRELLGMNTSYQPALILGGGDRLNWLSNSSAGMSKLGGLNGATGAAPSRDDKKFNMIIYTLNGGYNVTPKLNIEGALNYAMAAEKPTGAYVDDEMGFEVDLKATYKIFDNLSYYVAAGYLFAGDYWKGTNTNNKVDDDYVLMNRLMLSF